MEAQKKSKSTGGGRPRRTLEDGQPKKMFWDGDLHPLVVAKLPEVVEGGRVSMKKLAKATGYCEYTLYKAFNFDKLSDGVAKSLLRVSEARPRPAGGEITKMDLLPFLLN